ncbi:hypothetical protein EYS14_22570 [Alteromonadaceae bacterium M269]|nr:hypothetical protein EYS14_22570 [Alteromonadaceae bacterium M269]
MKNVRSILFTILASFSVYTFSSEKSPIEERILFSNDLALNAHIYLISAAQGVRSLPTNLSNEELKQANTALTRYKQDTAQRRFHIVRAEGHVATMTANLYSNMDINSQECIDSCIVLKQFMPIYQKYIWPQQNQTNTDWIENAKPRLQQYGAEIEDQLNQLFQTAIIPNEHKVDLVDYIDRGATTSGRTPNTLLSSTDEGYRDWHALEMIFHEIAHTYASGRSSPLRKGIAGKFNSEALKKHRRIWHAIHFYTVGYVTKEVISDVAPNYTTYAITNNVYGRSWSIYLPLIQKHWTRYLRGELSMDQALEYIASDLSGS